MFRSKVTGAAAIRSIRYASTQAGAAKKVTSWGEKFSALSSSTVYWAKVAGELGKQVYVKEGLAPPTVGEFQTVYKNIWAQTIKGLSHPSTLKDAVSSLNFSKDQAIRISAYTVQILGLFAIGEVIGRRKFVGYKY